MLTDELGHLLVSWVFLVQGHSLKTDSKNEISHLKEGKQMCNKTTFIRSFKITLIMDQVNRCENVRKDDKFNLKFGSFLSP